MINIFQNFIKSPISFFINRSTSSRFYIKNFLAMAGESVKNKSDINLEHLPVKKNKINSDDSVKTRTVATMCGAWRPDEVDGGLIFVFKMRETCLSPDPTKECDYPENIEDFWEASLMINDDIQVLTALSFYATGSYQKPVGMNFLHGLSQPSVSNAVKEVTKALNSLSILQKYIRFPQTREERQTIINGYYNKFGFPGVLGCIDGTHVAIVRPNEHEERFFNRKHYHSRNVQIICDSDLNILNVDATYGGASHDAFIWRQSEINSHIQQLHNDGGTLWLLGDSGYPLRPWLLTPIVNAGPETPEQHYTNVHCKVRNTVERCIGVLKARWRCLLVHRVLHYDHHSEAKIINACCVLHNMANRERLPVPELSPADNQAERNQQQSHRDQLEDQNESQMLQDGRRQLSVIVQRLWNNRT